MIAVSLDDSGERRKRTIVEFHVNAVERWQNRRNFDQMNDDWLVRAKDLSGCQTENKSVANVSSGSGNCNANGVFHNEILNPERCGDISSGAGF